MSGLWQPCAGRVGKPKALAVVPQQPLVPTANLSLLSMLTYPAELEESEWDEATAVLLPLMSRLRVANLVERNDEGWAAVQNWETVLSMGEQQCLGFIRLIYHQVKWVILDEATSAMGEDLASECYKMLKERVSFHDNIIAGIWVAFFSRRLRYRCVQGVSYVSVSQAAEALRPFHSQELAMGAANARGWELSRLFSLDRDDDAAMELSLPSGAELGQRLATDGEQLLAAMRDVLAKMAPGQMEPPLEAEFAGVKRLLASGCRLDAAEVAAIEGEIAALDKEGSEAFAAGDRDAAYRNTVRCTALPPIGRSFL